MQIALACVLTVIIELAWMMLFGFRSRLDVILVISTNVATNLTLNLLLMALPALRQAGWVILLELAVVAVEYGIYAKQKQRSIPLLAETALANLLSYGIGTLVFTLF